MPKWRRKPKRRGYVRPSRAKPKTGWALRELEKLTGTPARTIRMYLERDVLPRPPFMGPATRYQRKQLIWLLAIRRLRTAERLGLKAIKARLQGLSPPALEAFATESVAAGMLADALGVTRTPASPSPGLPSASLGTTTMEGPLARWTRFELALGLELHVRDEASAAVVELVHRIRQLCATGSNT